MPKRIISKKKGAKKPEIINLPANDIEKEKMIYACLLCKQMFKDPGLCPNCNIVLKKKAG